MGYGGVVYRHEHNNRQERHNRLVFGLELLLRQVKSMYSDWPTDDPAIVAEITLAAEILGANP